MTDEDVTEEASEVRFALCVQSHSYFLYDGKSLVGTRESKPNGFM